MVRELIAVTKESLDRKPAPREVEVYQETIPCFVNMMKPEIDGGDVSQVAYEWYTNTTEQRIISGTSVFLKEDTLKNAVVTHAPSVGTVNPL